MKIGKALEQMRKIHKLSQNELSKQTGISQSLIGKYERDLRAPSIYVCIQLAEYYGISIDELIGRAGNDDKSTYEFEYQHGNTRLVHKENKA